MAELEAKFGAEISAQLIEGGGGAFEISLDGELIYSKLQAQRRTEAIARARDLGLLSD